jgi:hypothetical protein
MSLIRIGFGLVALGSLIGFTASASAEVRYNGFPKLGYYVVTPPAASLSLGKSSHLDARAEYPKAAVPASQSPFRKGGINARGI